MGISFLFAVYIPHSRFAVLIISWPMFHFNLPQVKFTEINLGERAVRGHTLSSGGKVTRVRLHHHPHEREKNRPRRTGGGFLIVFGQGR
jgi:hypothetical protein